MDVQLQQALQSYIPVSWFNNRRVLSDGSLTKALASLQLGAETLHNANDKWAKLAALISHVWPDVCPEGTVLSKLHEACKLQAKLGLKTRVFVKMDCDLPIAGSIKARGGLYEVLCHAAHLVRTTSNDDASEHDHNDLVNLFQQPSVKAHLAQHSVVVGSTGNLGLSVGTAAAALGMRAVVHMSVEAKEWKKRLLRARGAQVVEHAGDYGSAVAQGRAESAADPRSHFVDDEKSEQLFLGYAVAAFELKCQLDAAGVVVSKESPLVVHIPCGVGGAPGGICWGIAHVFGLHAHVFFAEPTHAPCCLAGLASGRHEGICVKEDLGLDGVTVADGLAVTRPSGLACRMTESLVAGAYTVDDSTMLAGVADLWDLEGIFIEPSCAAALAGFAHLATCCFQERGQSHMTPDQHPVAHMNGPVRVTDQQQEMLNGGLPSSTCGCDAQPQQHCSQQPTAQDLLLKGTHVVWATGGSLMPQAEKDSILSRAGALRSTCSPVIQAASLISSVSIV